MNAIILAAGKGTRLFPLTEHIPKPLIRVQGVPIIERQIAFLQDVGIDEIFVVVGYLSQYFDYLVQRFNVTLIYNPMYDTYNNLYSMFVALEHFGDSYVIEGDVYMRKNFFRNDLRHASYFSGFKRSIANEWILENEKGLLKNIWIANELGEGLKKFEQGANIMCGVSYWDKSTARIIADAIRGKVQNSGSLQQEEVRKLYWDNIVLELLPDLQIELIPLATDDWYEIDAYKDLTELKEVLVQHIPEVSPEFSKAI
ncbi:NTP transferase domain-containing protein [Chitinophaga sp.]|uniref:NTP transferase domain-containing protein n=1 Tax=Chitinophaga sp. TaxID=1869181 RepID=UPI0031E0B36D